MYNGFRCKPCLSHADTCFASQLYEMALKFEPDTALVSSGALATVSYEKTGA